MVAVKANPGRLPPTKPFNLEVVVLESRASKDDVIEVLEAILEELRKTK